MAEIHDKSGNRLARVDAVSFRGADLADQDLRGARIVEEYFEGANLAGVDLKGADIRNSCFDVTVLEKADFSNTYVENTTFLGAVGPETDFTNASLVGVRFDYATLTKARFDGARLINVAFLKPQIREASFLEATIGDCQFLGCIDLAFVHGLESTVPVSPSVFDRETLRASVSSIPRVFLEGQGYTKEEIKGLRNLYGRLAMPATAFLCHAEADMQRAERVKVGLRGMNVDCISYRDVIPAGDYWRAVLQSEIRKRRSFIALLSETACHRENVVDEILYCLSLEREGSQKKIVPVALDDYVFTDAARKLADAKTASGEWSEDWLRPLVERQVVRIYVVGLDKAVAVLSERFDKERGQGTPYELRPGSTP